MVSFHCYNSKSKLDEDILLKKIEDDAIVFVIDNGQKLIWTHNEYFAIPQDLSNLITNEEFASFQNLALNAIPSNSLATINGESIENGGNISIDLNLFIIVSQLPTENIQNNKIYLVKNGKSTDNKNVFDEYIYNTEDESWELLGQVTSEIDLSDYLKTSDADKKYMPKSGSTSGSSGSSGGASLSISQQGSFNNYGNNGQAFNAVRDLKGTTPIKYTLETGSGYPLNAASFGVKDNGTTAFSHKKYDTFNTETGAYTGAKNTAVLIFSGKSGLRYAKNTGSTSDVTDDMYKFVGVIDSPDTNQKVYSASQVDTIISALEKRIETLEEQLKTS